jgi:hypothetical protein
MATKAPRRLRVLATGTGEWRIQRFAKPFFPSPDARAIGFPDSDRLAVVTLEDRAWRELPVAKESLELALHPALDRTAVATEEAIAVVDAAGREIARRALPAEWAVAALAFDPTGGRLWTALRGRADGECVAALLDTATLAETGRAPVDGMGCEADALEIVPGPIVGVEAACGQDGTWVTLLRAGAGGAIERVGAIAGENDPFAFVGLAPCGSHAAGLTGSAVLLFSVPDGAILASHELEDEDAMSYVGAFADDALLVPDVVGGKRVVLVLDARTLEPREKRRAKFGDGASLYVLTGGLGLVPETREVWDLDFRPLAAGAAAAPREKPIEPPAKCTAPGCGGRAVADGLCATHLNQKKWAEIKLKMDRLKNGLPPEG